MFSLKSGDTCLTCQPCLQGFQTCNDILGFYLPEYASLPQSKLGLSALVVLTGRLTGWVGQSLGTIFQLNQQNCEEIWIVHLLWEPLSLAKLSLSLPCCLSGGSLQLLTTSRHCCCCCLYNLHHRFSSMFKSGSCQVSPLKKNVLGRYNLPICHLFCFSVF